MRERWGRRGEGDEGEVGEERWGRRGEGDEREVGEEG